MDPLVLAASITAAASICVAAISVRRSGRSDKRDDLLVATLSRLDTTMIDIAGTVGGLVADVETVKEVTLDNRLLAEEHLVSATAEVLAELRHHEAVDYRGWRWLKVPDEVLHPVA